MMRITSLRSVWATTKSRPREDTPKVTSSDAPQASGPDLACNGEVIT